MVKKNVLDVTGCALDPNASTMAFDYTLDDGKPQTRASTVGFGSLPNPIEHVRQVTVDDPGRLLDRPANPHPDRDAL